MDSVKVMNQKTQQEMMNEIVADIKLFGEIKDKLIWRSVYDKCVIDIVGGYIKIYGGLDVDVELQKIEKASVPFNPEPYYAKRMVDLEMRAWSQYCSVVDELNTKYHANDGGCGHECCWGQKCAREMHEDYMSCVLRELKFHKLLKAFPLYEYWHVHESRRRLFCHRRFDYHEQTYAALFVYCCVIEELATQHHRDQVLKGFMEEEKSRESSSVLLEPLSTELLRNDYLNIVRDREIDYYAVHGTPWEPEEQLFPLYGYESEEASEYARSRHNSVADYDAEVERLCASITPDDVVIAMLQTELALRDAARLESARLELTSVPDRAYSWNPFDLTIARRQLDNTRIVLTRLSQTVRYLWNERTWQNLDLVVEATFCAVVAIMPLIWFIGFIFAPWSVFWLGIAMDGLMIITMYELAHCKIIKEVAVHMVFAELFMMAVGLPFGISIILGVFPAVGEERLKRIFASRFGALGVWVFSVSEMFLYIHAFGWWVFPIRACLVCLHVVWSTLPQRMATHLHMFWNWGTFWISFVCLVGGLPASFLYPAMEHEVLREMASSLGIVAVCSLILTMTFLSWLLAWCSRQETRVEAQSRLLSVRDYEIRGFHLYSPDGRRLVRFPPLHEFAEWQRRKDKQIVDIMSRWDGFAPECAVKHYFAVIRWLQCPSVSRFQQLLTIQLQVLDGSEYVEMQARRRNREMHSITGNILTAQLLRDVANSLEGTNNTVALSVMARICTLYFSKSPLHVWFAAFSRETLECIPNFEELLAAGIDEVTEKGFMQWLVKDKGEPEPQSDLGFTESPLYKAFIRVVQSTFVTAISGEYADWKLFKVLSYVSFIEFFTKLLELCLMAKDVVVEYWAYGTVSFLLSSFAQLEAEVDRELASGLPSPTDKHFNIEKSKKLARLKALSSKVELLSRGKPELTHRHAMLVKKIEEVENLLLSTQLGKQPVIFMFGGRAGVSKSTFTWEFNSELLRVLDAIPDGVKTDKLIYIYRHNGNKHIDALNKPELIKAFQMDDFQQNTYDTASLIAELVMFHAMASHEKTALPFASLEGKANATNLQPDVLTMATNNDEEVFKAANFMDVDSLARRLDLFVEMLNLTEYEFSADHIPGDNDIEFRFYTIKYSKQAGKGNPVKIPKPLQGVVSTRSRVVALRLLVAHARTLRLKRDSILHERLTSDVCEKSAKSRSSHYGFQCKEGCSFGDLELPPGLDSPVVVFGAIDRDSYNIVEVSDLSKLRYFNSTDGTGYYLSNGGEKYVVNDFTRRLNPHFTFPHWESPRVIPQSEERKEMAKLYFLISLACCVIFMPDAWKVPVVLIVVFFLLMKYIHRLPLKAKLSAVLYYGYTYALPVWWTYVCETDQAVRLEIENGVNDVEGRIPLSCPVRMRRMVAYGLFGQKRLYESRFKRVVVSLQVLAGLSTAYFLVNRLSNVIKRDPVLCTDCKEDDPNVQSQMSASNMPTAPSRRITEVPHNRRILDRVALSGERTSGKPAEVIPIVQAAIAEIFLGKEDRGTRVGYAFAVGGGDFVTVAHQYFESMNLWMVLSSGAKEKGQQVRAHHQGAVHSHYVPGGSDVVVFGTSVPNRRSLLPHCLPVELLRKVRGKAFMIFPDKIVDITIVGVREQYAFLGGVITEGFEYDIHEMKSYKGLCGIPIGAIDTRGNFFLLGEHHANLSDISEYRCLGQFVSKETLAGMYTAETHQGTEIGAKPQSELCGAFREWSQEWIKEKGWDIRNPFPDLLPAKQTGRTAFLPIPGECVGRFDRPTVRLTSNLRPSKMSLYFPEGGVTKYAPAWMKDIEVEPGVWKGPFATLGQSPLVNLSIDSRALELAMEDMRMTDEVGRAAYEGLTPLDCEQAVRGIPGVMNAMNLNTSAGYGREGEKKQEFIIRDLEEGVVEVDSNLMREVEELVEHPEPFWLPIYGCFKDEIRPIEKASSTRMFTIFPMAFLFVCRMFISCILAIWRSDPLRAETLIGQNAAGPVWTMLGTVLDEPWYDSWYICADFKKYDKSFTSVLKACVYTHIEVLASWTAFTLGQLEVVSNLLKSLLHAVLIIYNDVFIIPDWQHSGDPMTVEVNSLGQRLLYRYWYYKFMPLAIVGSFRNWVRLFTYGDDGLARVRKHPALTPLTFVDAMSDWGMQVTSSSKGVFKEESREALSFLKRAIVYDPLFGGYRAPLEEASIYKMLCWFDVKSAICEDSWVFAVVDNAAAEWFLHGRDRFETETQRLKDAVADLGLPYTGREWEEYMDRYSSSKFQTWDL